MRVCNIFKTFLKFTGVVIVSAFVGLFLLWIAYKLPTNRMAENMADSKYTLMEQEEPEKYLTLNWSSILDTNTNLIILREVIYPNRGQSLQDALLVPSDNFYFKSQDVWLDDLIMHAETRTYAEGDYYTYARYWHGHLAVLKPLFMFFDLQEIYVINTFVLTIMTVYISYLMYKRLGKYVSSYVLVVLLMNPVNIVQSVQLSTVFYVMQIALFAILKNNTYTRNKDLYIFLFAGILLAYIDFLTYPLVAFAIPALTSFILHKEKNLLEDVLSFVYRGIAFVMGYLGMWGMKWILASVLTSENVIADAIYNVLHRVGVVEDPSDQMFLSVSAVDALDRNLKAFFNETNIVILMVSIAVFMFWIITRKYKIVLEKETIFICTMIACLPFAWVMILSNHCSLHPHLEWRTFAVLIYAILIMVLNSIRKKD